MQVKQKEKFVKQSEIVSEYLHCKQSSFLENDKG